MTDLATALAADPSKFTPYRGKDVVRTSVKIKNTGDGLSKNMKIDPVELEPGDVVYVTLECRVGDHSHKLIEDSDVFELIQYLYAGTAILVDGDLVEQQIAAQKERLLRAQEAAEGVARLPYTEELQKQHDAGEHAQLVEGCPDCDAEIEAEEAGD